MYEQKERSQEVLPAKFSALDYFTLIMKEYEYQSCSESQGIIRLHLVNLVPFDAGV